MHYDKASHVFPEDKVVTPKNMVNIISIICSYNAINAISRLEIDKESGDTKGVIRIRKLKNRQDNGQKSTKEQRTIYKTCT